MIKGKVSIRKTHIFDKFTNQIVIKPLYKVIMMKKPMLLRSTRRKSSNSLFLKSSKEKNTKSTIEINNNNNNNSINNKINNINKNINNDLNNNDINRKESSKELNEIKNNSKATNKSVRRMQTSIINNNINNNKDFNNKKEEKLNKNFRIVKEIFDPEKYIISEEELFRMGEGYCFGEWALIYNEPRSASIYTLEDCVFFTLDEIHFKNSFLKSLNNSEYSKKKFALKNFLPFDMMNERQLSIYKNIVPITCKQNQIIFNEGDTSDSIYLIYLGSFTLEKKYGAKQFRVLNLEKGSIVGLESIFEGEDSKYKCSLKLSRGIDVGLIFQLRINKLRPYIINKMRKSFKTNYNLFLKSWNDLFCKNVIIQQKLTNEKIEDIMGDEAVNDFLLYFNEINEQIDFNGDLFNKNWNSVLNIEQEDKYELLFKDCLKTKLYDNHKKDGSLRIFSSRQKNKIYEYNNKNENNLKKFSIFFFKNMNMNKADLDKINSISTNSLGFQKMKNLYINEGSQSNKNNQNLTLKINKNDLNLTEIKKNNLLNEDEEEITNKISFNDEKILLKTKNKLKNFKNELIQNSKSLKINKKILYEKNIIKENDLDISEKNKYTTIHLKNNSLLSGYSHSQRYISIINKQKQNFENLENKNPKTNIKFNINNISIKEKNPNIVNENLDIVNIQNNSTFREYIKDKNNLCRNNSLLPSNQNSKNTSNDNKKLNLNNLENKIFYHKINESNSCKISQNFSLLRKTKSKFENENKGNVTIFHKKFSSLEQKNYSPVKSNNLNNLYITFQKDNFKNIHIKNTKNKRNNKFDKNKIYKFIKNSNSSIRNKLLKNENSIF